MTHNDENFFTESAQKHQEVIDLLATGGAFNSDQRVQPIPEAFFVKARRLAEEAYQRDRDSAKFRQHSA